MSKNHIKTTRQEAEKKKKYDVSQHLGEFLKTKLEKNFKSLFFTSDHQKFLLLVE